MMHAIDIEKLARGIRPARIDHGLTQSDLAREMDLHIGRVQEIEQGRADLKSPKVAKRVRAIAEHLDMKIPRLKNGADHYRGTGQAREEGGASCAPELREIWSKSILETHVGPKEEEVKAPTSTPDFTVTPDLQKIAPSLVDEPVSFVPSKQGLRRGATPWGESAPDIDATQEDESTPDLELVVMGEGNRQLERLSDPKARRRVLLYWMDRYVRTDSPHLLEGEE